MVVSVLGASTVTERESWPVRPIDSTRFRRTPPSDEESLRFATFVGNACRYGMTTWYEDLKGYDLEVQPYLSPAGFRNGDIRPLGAFAETCAIALVTGAMDGLPGAPPTDVISARTIRLLTAVARSNRANGGGWGGSKPVPHGTDSTNLAAPAMLAAWLLWPSLTVDEQTFVTNMAAYEAKALMAVPIRYFRDAKGKVLSKGNSGTEELVWNTTFLSLMVNMFPSRPEQSSWEQRLVRSTIAAWARPADVNSAARINGNSVAEWIDGSNLNPDGTVTNGNIDVHPFYMTALGASVFQVAAYALGGRDTPNAVRFNADVVYKALVDREFTVADGYEPPGGTIYVPGAPDIYYPKGSNKQSNAYIAFAFVDYVVGLLGADENIEPKADVWEGLHANKALELQRRSSDGSSNLTEAEGGAGEEFWVAYWGARGHLVKQLVRQVGVTLHDRPITFSPGARPTEPPNPV